MKKTKFLLVVAILFQGALASADGQGSCEQIMAQAFSNKYSACELMTKKYSFLKEHSGVVCDPNMVFQKNSRVSDTVQMSKSLASSLDGAVKATAESSPKISLDIANAQVSFFKDAENIILNCR